MTYYFRTGMLQILNILAFVSMILVNGLADFLPINGQTTGQISDSYPNLFVPAPITFAIWAVIYSLLFLFCIYQASTLFESEKRYTDKKERMVGKIGPLFIISCLLNISWILAWHYHQLLLSIVIMFALLITLILIFRRLHESAPFSGRERWFVSAPFSVYLGWISIATIANITAWLVSINWNGWNLPGHTWTIIMIAAGAIPGIIVLMRHHNIFYPLAVTWAFAGIAIKQHQQWGFNNIAWVAIASSVLLLLLVVVKQLRTTPAKKEEG